MATDFVSSSRQNDIPVFAGSEVISFKVSQMPPGIRIFTYVNNINITPFTAPTTTSLMAEPIITDQLGEATGLLFIPSTEGSYKFLTGEIRLTFTDNPDSIEKSTYIAETTIYNHGINLVDTEQGSTITLRTTEKFRADPAGTSVEGTTTTTSRRLDPLAQTFIVEESKYPLGVVLTGINLFFLTKDDKLPVAIELRPLENGVPSRTQYFSGSFAIVYPNNVKIPTELGTDSTIFTFEHPVYLKPGEYAFCVLTKSDKYNLFTAKLGVDGITIKQPYAGTLYKAQNVGDWVGTTNEDLTFVIRKAKFETGTVTFEMQNPAIYPLDYNKLRLLSSEISMGNTAFVNYRLNTVSATTRSPSGYAEVLQNSEPNLDGRKQANAAGDIKLEISLTTKSKDVAPFLDKQLIKAQIFRNNIVPYSDLVSKSELGAKGGFAPAKYVSKVVSLEEGFDSTTIDVKLDVNRKTGTDIEVYCRVLARDDKSLEGGILERPWVRMPLVFPLQKTFAGTSDDTFFNEEYRIDDPFLSYDGYSNFAHYQIKVVFYASNPVYVPKIRNLIAVALI